MSIFTTVKKLFFRNKLFIFLYSLFIASAGYHCIKCLSYGDGIFETEKELLYIVIFAFVFFTFLSYEFCRLCKKNNLEESLECSFNSYKKIVLAQIKLLFFLVIIFLLIVFIAEIIVFFQNPIFNLDFILQIFFGIILNYFLVPFTAVVFGLALSVYSNRLNSYLLIVLVTLLGTPYFENILGIVYDTLNINLYPVFRIFCFFPVDLNWSPVQAFGNTILPYRWGICLFWCSFLLVLVFYKISIPKKREYFIKRIPILALSLIMLFVGVIPSSKILLESWAPNESGISDEIYYCFQGENSDLNRNKKAEFSIKQLDAKLTIGNKLYAVVKITPDNTNLKEYIFTLYHQYKIIKITDENNNILNYEQEGDYITVYNQHPVKQICFTYSGFSGTYYSNVQGVFLPSFFPYLPHSGWESLYDVEQTGVNRFYFNDDIQINLKVNSLRKVFCNLNEVDKNTFSGNASGVTIVSGLYDETIVDGIRVVRPYLERLESNKKIEEIISKYKGTVCLNNEIETIFIEPLINLHSAYNRYADYNDHLILEQSIAIDTLYISQTTAPGKRNLNQIYLGYLEGKEDIIKLSKEMPDSIFEYFIDYLEYCGEEQGLENINNFINDDSDKRTGEVFLKER